MNDVPPQSHEPSDDDIDSLYRRASALDSSGPGDRVREAVLGHARKVAGEAAQHASETPTAIGSGTRIVIKQRRYPRWWRPAAFGTLAAAALVGILVLPQIIAPHVAPRTAYSSAQRSEPSESSQAVAPPSTGAASPPTESTPTVTSPLAAPLAPKPAPDSASAPAVAESAYSRARASAAAPAKPSGARDSREPSAPADLLESVTVSGQRKSANDLMTPSPVATSEAPTESARAAGSGGATGGLETHVGSPEALRRAAETGDLKGLQRSLDQPTDINSQDDAGRTALLLAALHGQTKAVKWLLAHGADPNTADANGMTPLSAATTTGQSAIIEALKRAGAR